MAAGERAIFTLRVSRGTEAPPQEFFMPEVPPGAILAALPVTAAERAGGVVIKLNLVPLDGDFNLPARVLQYENTRFEIPALHIRVSGRVHSEGSAIAKEPPQSATHPAQFPELPNRGSDSTEKKRRQLEEICDAARDLWNDGHRAQALAELRRNERDHSSGALLAAVRREAEESIGLYDTGNESRLWRKVFFGLTLFFIHIVIISLVVCFALKRVSWRKRAFFCAVASAALALLCFRFTGPQSAGSGRCGVMLEASVRRTADLDGEELFRFTEGQPVAVMLNSGSWLYVRANSASRFEWSGWVPAEAVILY